MKPCPHSCAAVISSFEVDGIPDARGVHRIATAEDIEAAGTENEVPSDSYWVGFTVGSIVYAVDLHGPPGSVSEEQAQEIASAYYDAAYRRLLAARHCRHGPVGALDEIASNLDSECEWLVTNGVLPTDMVTRNRQIAEAALRPWTPVFTHGDLQITHVFVDGDEITGVIDWSEASQGDALYDLASLTLGHEEHLADVVAGYGTDVDLDVIYAWWSLRSLLAARWLIEHGFDPSSTGCEFDVLRSRM